MNVIHTSKVQQIQQETHGLVIKIVYIDNIIFIVYVECTELQTINDWDITWSQVVSIGLISKII